MALVRGSPGVSGSDDTPQAQANFSRSSRIGHLLVAGENIGKRPHVAPPLHVVLSPERIDAGAGSPHVAGEERQGGAAADIVHAMAVLGDPHGVDDHGPVRSGKKAGGGNDLLRGETGNGGGPLRRPVSHRFGKSGEIFRPGGDELPVFQPLGDDDLHHAVQQRHVAAVGVAQVEIGMAGEADAAVVGDDQPRPPPGGVQDAAADEGMLLGGVGADDEDQVGLVDTGDGIGHRPRTEGLGEPDHRGGVAETGAMIDVVGAEYPPGKLHQQVILLVGRLCGGGEHQGVAAVPLLHPLQSPDHEIQRLVPGGGMKRAVPTHQRNGQAVGVMDEGVGVPPLDAEAAPADRMGRARFDTNQPPAVADQVEHAAGAAVGTNRESSLHADSPSNL